MKGAIRLTDENSGLDHGYTAVPQAPVYVAHPVDFEDDSDDAGDSAVDGFEIEGEQRKDFELGLFGCFNNPLLFLNGAFLSPCIFGRANVLMARKPNQDPEAMASHWTGYLNQSCLGFMCLAACTHGIGNVIWHTIRRGNVRNKYNIKGNRFQDFAVSCLCAPCSLVQEDFEVLKREIQLKQQDFKFQQRDSEHLV